VGRPSIRQDNKEDSCRHREKDTQKLPTRVLDLGLKEYAKKYNIDLEKYK